MKQGVKGEFQSTARQRYEVSLPCLADRLAHKLRNPLSVITTASSQLESVLKDNLEDDENSMLQAIIIAADRMEEIIGEFIYYATVPAGEVEVADLNSICRAELKNISYEHREIKSEFQTNNPVITIECDLFRLRRVISSVLRNSFQSIKDGGEIRIRTSSSGEMASIQVADSGEGIPSENSDLIFSPFYTTQPGQIGLGLSIADKLIQAIGGSLDISDRDGKGTMVNIKLPLKSQNRSDD